MSATSTLGRYVAARFLWMIVGSFSLCAGLIYMIDFVEMLRQAGKHGNVGMATISYITLLRLPAYTEILLTFAVLAGSIFVLISLNRKSELAVMRAGGMSAWQFLWPGIGVAFLLGVFAVTIYNPLSARARAEAERVHAEAFGKPSNFLRQQSDLAWLRQNGKDGQSVIWAASSSQSGLLLTSVQVLQFDQQKRFKERVYGKRAMLREGYWEIVEGWVRRPGKRAQKFEKYRVSTYLTPNRVLDAMGSVRSLSFWQLPGVIEVVEKAKLSSASYHVQYQLLLSRPFLLVTMVLLGATVSLKSFRSGGVQTMVTIGVLGGIGFFLMVEVSRQIGIAGLVAPWVAVWVPVAVGMALSVATLLLQEDG